jgi:KDO2-lipid IV(A) lauroyltransferase
MTRKRSTLRLKAEAAAVRTVFALLGAFPLRASMAIGIFFAKAAVFLFPRLLKTAKRNLEIAMPDLREDERDRIAKGSYRSLGRQMGFVSHFHKFDRDDIQNLIGLVGREENFDPAIDKGTGILFFTGHFGSWEVFNLLSPSFGYEMNILVRRIDNPYVEEFVESLRSRFGSVTVGKKEIGRGLYKILENGGLLGILADLNAQHHDGVFVDFFGVPACTTKSIAKIALRTRTVVMPAFAVWEEKEGKYVVYLEEPIDFGDSGNQKEDVYELTRKITESVEKFVRKYPEQWLWIHKRWKTRPKGEKGLY